MKDKFFSACSNRRIRMIYLIAAGIFAGFQEGAGITPILCLVTMLPLFTVLECKTPLEHIKRALPFLASYNITKTCFLITVRSLLDFPAAAGFITALGAVVGTAAIMLVSSLFCLLIFSYTRANTAADIITLSLLYSLSELICENIGLMSFPWLGVWAQADGAYPVMMSASLLGCRFTTFLILLANGLIFLALKSFYFKKPKNAMKCLACLAILTVSVFCFGNYKINSLKAQSETAPTIGVMAVQLDCEGEEKDSMSAWEAAVQYAELIENSFDASSKIVFLPETAVHASFDNGDAFRLIEDIAKEHDCYILTGCFRKEGGKKYNSVIVYSPTGLTDSVHDKCHLIPFGEYMPFANITGADRMLYEPESCGDPLIAADVSIACGICIESIYSDVFVHQVRRGAELIYIPTNDSWFGDSFARRAHYVHSQMRAIETSRFIVRAGNCGISAVMTPWGDELAVQNGKEKSVITAAAPLLKSKSLYTIVGDFYALIPLSAAVISLLFRSRSKKSA